MCVHVCVSAVLGCCVDLIMMVGTHLCRLPAASGEGRGVDPWLCGSLQGATSAVAGDSHASGERFVSLTAMYSQTVRVLVTLRTPGLYRALPGNSRCA